VSVQWDWLLEWGGVGLAGSSHQLIRFWTTITCQNGKTRV